MGGRGASYKGSQSVGKKKEAAGGNEGADTSGSGMAGVTDVVKGRIDVPGGLSIEFDGDLRYSGKAAELTGSKRQVVEAWEKKRVTAKVEYAMAWDENGRPIGPEKRGGKGSVRTPYQFHMTPNSTFTHIHPREKGSGELGGTFSTADLYNFSAFNNKTFRAKAREGTYSISKTSNFDAKGFMTFVREEERTGRKKFKSVADSIVKDYHEGRIDYKSAVQMNAKAFNNYLISKHDSYLANQKKYGYTYGLEK